MKEAGEATAYATRSKCPISDSPIYKWERFANHFQQQVLFFQTELKKTTEINKLYQSLLVQLSKQSDVGQSIQEWTK